MPTSASPPPGPPQPPRPTLASIGRGTLASLIDNEHAADLGRRLRALPIALAMRETIAQRYTKAKLRADLLAGLVVGIVALPLSMALAIAVGVAPQHGLYTAIVAGAVIALLGGCRFQVSGPTAAFIVILAPITEKYGLSGLLTAGFIAGLMLLGMGLARLGQFIQFIPYPVTTGFTTGIGVVIATLQVKDIFGLAVAKTGDHYPEKLAALWDARWSFRLPELCIAVLTFGLLLILPRVTRRIPPPLIALSAAGIIAFGVSALFPSITFDTLGTRFSTVIDGVTVQGIPRALPTPVVPWGDGGITFSAVQELLPSAFAIAMLGAIESLLSGVIADGMTGTRHDPDAELVGLGVGNILAPMFGGIAATGALARTATNVRSGAVSPISAVVHAAVVLLSVVALAPLVAYVPMSALAALLLLVAWNMSELPQFVNTIRIAPKSDVTVLLLCFGLTVIFDMVIAIVVGVVLAALLFMKRMGELAGAKVVLPSSDQRLRVDVPDGVALYDIQGPLFFGAAKNAMSAIGAIASAHPRAVVIHLGNVPVIDATGLVALDSAIGSMLRQKVPVVLAGPLPKPERIFAKARLTTKYEHLRIAPTLAEAFALASRFEPAPLSRKSMTPAPPGTLPGSSRPSATPARPSVIPRGPGEAP